MARRGTYAHTRSCWPIRRSPAPSSSARGGDPAKADPEELFVASLSSCHMLWFLDFARREHIRVLSYEDDPEGTMDDRRFVSVVLRPRVQFGSDVSKELREQLHERSHEACFIANSVSCEVRIESFSVPHGSPRMD